jgi:hypothetical protein
MELMDEFAHHIKTYRGKKNIEIEFRLGKVNLDTFDTNVGKSNFDKIMNGLRAYTQWESVKVMEDEIFYWPNGVRCIYDGNESTYQKKVKILTKNKVLSSKSLDVRLSIAQENPVSCQNQDATRSVMRKRTSFLRKNVRIDMTTVTGQSRDKDCEDLVQYQVELEVTDASSDQLIFSAVHKILNVLELLS